VGVIVSPHQIHFYSLACMLAFPSLRTIYLSLFSKFAAKVSQRAQLVRGAEYKLFHRSQGDGCADFSHDAIETVCHAQELKCKFHWGFDASLFRVTVRHEGTFSILTCLVMFGFDGAGATAR